jgi:hypothetical protein
MSVHDLSRAVHRFDSSKNVVSNIIIPRRNDHSFLESIHDRDHLEHPSLPHVKVIFILFIFIIDVSVEPWVYHVVVQDVRVFVDVGVFIGVSMEQ